MTKEIIQVEVLDVIKHGLAGYSDIITSSYGETNGVVEDSFNSIYSLRDLYCEDVNKITGFIRRKLKDGETFVLLPHKLEELENFSDADTQFIIEVLDNGNHIGYIDGKDVNW